MIGLMFMVISEKIRSTKQQHRILKCSNGTFKAYFKCVLPVQRKDLPSRIGHQTPGSEGRGLIEASRKQGSKQVILFGCLAVIVKCNCSLPSRQYNDQTLSNNSQWD
jgi:hypothetical protein